MSRRTSAAAEPSPSGDAPSDGTFPVGRLIGTHQPVEDARRGGDQRQNGSAPGHGRES